MNVIFLDFDGVIDTIHFKSREDVVKRIKLLSEICKEFNCKIVVEAACKRGVIFDDEETYGEWFSFVLSLFNKYNIECIGITPNIDCFINGKAVPFNKGNEIKLYLYRHPEVDHFCIIDDDDLGEDNSDLKKVKEYLVKTIYYSKNYDEEGLLPKHKEEVGKILKLENKYKKLAIKRSARLNNN